MLINMEVLDMKQFEASRGGEGAEAVHAGGVQEFHAAGGLCSEEHHERAAEVSAAGAQRAAGAAQTGEELALI